jgi:hypothetical protein
MDRYGGPHTLLSMALHGRLYSPNKLDRYEVPHTALNGGLYFSIIMDCHVEYHKDLTRAFHGDP